MKILKKILIVLVILIALVLVVALFVKKEYAVSRETTINKSKQEVFDFIKFLKNQATYSVWVMRDPQMKKEYTGTDGTVGCVYAWDGNDEVGKGEQEITKIDEGEKVGYELRFIKPFEGKGDAELTTESLANNQTKVTWTFKSSMKYPMNIMLLCMNMNDMIGKDLQTGLDNLKAVLEK